MEHKENFTHQQMPQRAQQMPQRAQQRKRENFTVNYSAPSNVTQLVTDVQMPCVKLVKGSAVPFVAKAYEFADDNENLELNFNNPNYFSRNQRLVGNANPKTMIPPVVAPPLTDIDYWKSNNLVVRSNINDESQVDMYQSGFQVSTCCGNTKGKYLVPRGKKRMDPNFLKENYDGSGGCLIKKPPNLLNRSVREDFHEGCYDVKKSSGTRPAFVEYQGEKYRTDPRPPIGGHVNTTCGYDPDQLFESNLPANLPTGKCERNRAMKEFNENLFTQIIEPGVYYRSQVNEPINANMGISYTQQFNPTTCSVDKDGGLLYTEHDPRLIEPYIPPPEFKEGVNMSNVYDPRHTGYGTSYRAYNDKLLGQPKFMYDDVDAVRMPKYISRSNIDHLPFADGYGPIREGFENGNPNHANIRALANDAWLRNSLDQRTAIQASLMRKTNNQRWQRKIAPIRTMGSYMAGSGLRA